MDCFLFLTTTKKENGSNHTSTSGTSLYIMSLLISNIVVTAYCSCQICCGPNASNITASGNKPRQGITVAAPRSIPFGTKLYIPSIGWRTVEDRLAKKYDNRVDVYYKSHKEAKRFGKKQLTITIKNKPGYGK